MEGRSECLWIRYCRHILTRMVSSVHYSNMEHNYPLLHISFTCGPTNIVIYSVICRLHRKIWTVKFQLQNVGMLFGAEVCYFSCSRILIFQSVQTSVLTVLIKPMTGTSIIYLVPHFQPIPTSRVERIRQRAPTTW